MLLLTRGATVTYCHSRTADPPAPVRKADVGVATVGRPRPPRSADVKPDLQVALASPRRGPGLPSANGRGIPARRGGRVGRRASSATHRPPLTEQAPLAAGLGSRCGGGRRPGVARDRPLSWTRCGHGAGSGVREPCPAADDIRALAPGTGRKAPLRERTAEGSASPRSTGRECGLPAPRLTQRPKTVPATDRSRLGSVRGVGDTRWAATGARSTPPVRARSHHAQARSIRCLPRSPVRSRSVTRHAVTTMAAKAGQHREALVRPPVRGLTRSGEGPVARREARRSAARRDRGGQPSGPGPGCVVSLI